VDFVVGINFELGDSDVNLVSNVDFESIDLVIGPGLPVPKLVFMIILPVFGGDFDFKSILSFEFFNSDLELDIELVSNNVDFFLHFDLEVGDDDLSIFMKGKAPLFNEDGDAVIVFLLFHCNEYLDHVIEFSGNFSDSELVLVLSGDSPFFNGDDPLLFFFVHKTFEFKFK
jgi:hypothetical protein